MSKEIEQTYYVITHDGEPVLHGHKAHLYKQKEDASPVEGDVLEKVKLVRVKEGCGC